MKWAVLDHVIKYSSLWLHAKFDENFSATSKVVVEVCIRTQLPAVHRAGPEVSLNYSSASTGAETRRDGGHVSSIIWLGNNVANVPQYFA